MSKELEALERIGKLETVGIRIVPTTTSVKDFADYYIIETALKDLEWLKTKLDIDFMNRLSVPEDKIRLLKIMGLEIEFNE